MKSPASLVGLFVLVGLTFFSIFSELREKKGKNGFSSGILNERHYKDDTSVTRGGAAR